MQVLLETKKAVNNDLARNNFFYVFYHKRKDCDRKIRFKGLFHIFIKTLGVKDKNHDKIEGNTY